MPTINDVAKMAGVSKTLVSRVINNKSGVGKQNKENILLAIEELGYKPNILARSLVLKQTNTIGILLDSLSVPFYFDFINRVTKEGQALGYNVLFSANADNTDVKMNYVNYFTQGNADGIITYGSQVADTPMICELATSKFPLVVVEHDIEDILTNKVLLDNTSGAQMAVEHLISKGCKDIRYFMGDTSKKIYLDRLKGYTDTMKANGLKIGENSIISCSVTEKSGYMSMMDLIKSNNMPEAIFFAGDTMAYGAIRALYENNYQIPEDIKLIGFDDDKPESFDMVFPKLSTVRQPLEKMASKAIHMLDIIIKNKSKNKNTLQLEEIVMPELVIRETT